MGLLSAADLAAVRSTLHGVANATLTAVRGPGAKDRHGEPTGSGASLWSGSIRGFLDREQALSVDAPQADPARGRYTDRSTLTILDTDASGALDDLLREPWRETFIDVTDSESVTATFKVVDVVHDAPATLGSVTLILVPEPVVA